MIVQVIHKADADPRQEIMDQIMMQVNKQIDDLLKRKKTLDEVHSGKDVESLRACMSSRKSLQTKTKKWETQIAKMDQAFEELVQHRHDVQKKIDVKTADLVIKILKSMSEVSLCFYDLMAEANTLKEIKAHCLDQFFKYLPAVFRAGSEAVLKISKANQKFAGLKVKAPSNSKK